MVGYLDRFSRQDSPCHRLPTGTKLLLAFSTILGSLLLPAESWPGQVALLGLILAAQSLAKVPFGYVVHRVVRFLPFVVMFCFSIWLGSRGEIGMSSSSISCCEVWSVSWRLCGW